jgi:hypothetical protein
MKEPYKKGVANHLDPESCAETGNRESPLNATESQTLGMRGNSLHGNRETPKASTAPNVHTADGAVERPEKAQGRTSGMHVFGESDGSIVPQKQANKADLSAAESVEGRGPTKGNDLSGRHVPDPVPDRRGRGWQGVREAAGAAARHRPEAGAV